MGKFSLLRDTDKASWPKIRSSSCVLNQGSTCASHTLFLLCLSASLSCFREQPFWVNFNTHVFPGTTGKVLPCSPVPCLFIFMGWQNPEQPRMHLFIIKLSSRVIFDSQAVSGNLRIHPPFPLIPTSLDDQ